MQTWILTGLVLAFLSLSPGAALAQSEALTKVQQQGMALFKAGQFSKAAPVLKKALELSEREIGPETTNTILILNILTITYKRLGRFGEAETVMKRAQPILEKKLGPDHMIVARWLDSLAMLYLAQGRYAEAEPLYKRALAIMEKSLGPEHPKVTAVRKKLAALRKAQDSSPVKILPLNQIPMYGNVEKTPEMKRADEEFFSDILKTGVSREKAAVHLVKRGWEALARKDPRTAIKKFNQSWLLDPKNGGAYWGFAMVLHVRDKDTSGATEMFERARELLPKNARLLSDYGTFFQESGRPKKAIEVLRRAISINEKTPSAYEALVKSYLALKDAKMALHYAQLGKKFGTPIDDQLISVLKTGAVPATKAP